jgi:mannosyl-glycoprotein endo-beta-N-acetylglucosaminidase
VLLCHDYKGGYLDDANVQGSPAEKCYTLSKFWSLIDIFVYFSHHTITIPPVCWTQAAHTNSVSVLGTIITEGEHGQLENLLMIFGDLKNKSSFSCKYADLLVDMAVYYNFDGWFVNLESPLRKEYIPHLISFLKYLTARMHQAKSGSLIIWYDALTVDGAVDWQDKLTFKNKVTRLLFRSGLF